MSAFMTQDDFLAIGRNRQPPFREIALEDAWARFATFNGSATEFFNWADSPENKPHWFSAPAPDTPESAVFYSRQAQSAFVREHGEAALTDLLKTENLKPGFTKAPVKTDPAAMPDTLNPWSRAFSGSEQERNARIASVCKMGTKLANDLAKAAGTVIHKPLRR